MPDVELGFSPSTPGIGAADLVRLCGDAERLGYRSVWAAEVAGPGVFGLLGAVAASTERIGLGVAVVSAATRSPALLAMEAATVSQVAGGRPVAIGVGASSRMIVESWHGAAFAPAQTRVAEVVAATRALLAGERTWRGTTVAVDRFSLATPPAGPISLLVGALGPGMLRTAGAVGDGVCLNLMPARVVSQQREQVAAGAEAAGRSLPAGFTVMARLHLVVTDDVVSGRQVVRRAFGPYFAQPVYNRFLAWIGYPEEAVALGAAFAVGDREGVGRAMHDALVDDIALVGPAQSLRERIAEYGSAGIDVAAINPLTGSADEVARALTALSPHAGQD